MKEIEAMKSPPVGGARKTSETERAVMEVWRDVFRLDEVSPDDDVLELGVNSLAAVEMCVRLEQRFGVEVTAASLLTASTVAQLAALIDERRAG